MTDLQMFRFTPALIAAFAIMALGSCNGLPVGSNDVSRNLSDFGFLELGMSYEKIVEAVGEADRDAGSGLYLKIYDLADGRQITLQFATLDTLMGVFLYDPDTDQDEVILGSTQPPHRPMVG